MCPKHSRAISMMRTARRWNRWGQWLLLGMACALCAVQVAASTHLLPWPWPMAYTILFAVQTFLLGLTCECTEMFSRRWLHQLHTQVNACNHCQRTAKGATHVH